jgi:aminopeptidase N
VKRWVDGHAYGSADWRDLVRDLGAAAGRELETTIAPWVDEEGMPEIRLERSADGRLTVVAEDLLGRARHWPQSIRIRSYAPGRAPCDTTVELAGTTTAFEPGPECRDTELWLLNAGDYGYGRFRLRTDEVDAAFCWAGDAHDPLDRALLWEALWEEVRDARLPPSAFVVRVLGALGRESNALVQAQLLARIEFAWRHWMSVGQRAALGPVVERTLLAMTSEGPDLARRVAAMRALISMAATSETRTLVRSWLRGVTEPPAPWQVRDAFAVVRTLMAAEVPGAEEDLQYVAARAAGGDDARRQAYAAGASAPRQSVKREYFDSWLRDASIPEAWIEDALGPLNTPDHHLVTLSLLREALDAVPVLSRTHKIFFVNRWLEAFAGGQRTAEAAALIRTAAANTDLPLSLRRKVLMVLEPLERTVRIRDRWARP